MKHPISKFQTRAIDVFPRGLNVLWLSGEGTLRKDKILLVFITRSRKQDQAGRLRRQKWKERHGYETLSSFIDEIYMPWAKSIKTSWLNDHYMAHSALIVNAS